MRPPFGTWVRGNGWDELDGQLPDPLPTVSVIVTHYDQPRELRRMLHALERQDYPTDLVQIIVADDGSPDVPAVPPGVELVRQPDDGFRAAAVRNLGARSASGDVLCFLDADTAPEPGYVRAITRLPALLPEAVTVGRRRHADFTDVGVDAPLESAAEPRELPEPAWLSEAYERSANLLNADDRSYRYIIGAAFACTRWFYDELGGMDESFTVYGGEDWEWAHRAWQHGAVFAHVRDAVAWHDGPEWAGRKLDPAERRRDGNAQSLLLTRAIPLDGSRGHGIDTGTPDVVFRLHGRHPYAATFVGVDSVLAAFPRARVQLEHGAGTWPFAADPRVGEVRPDRPDARVVVDLDRPVALRGASASALADGIRSLGHGDIGALSLRAASGETFGRAESRRAHERRRRWGTDAAFEVAELDLPEAIVLGDAPAVEAYVGGWAHPHHLA
ncbi:glycosyltransferase family 2 protein [Microbacterium sp. P04]|uniref:glycosyltransferase family 2 protein n=1 Tax=Microbacterium sp. P04 TaxID=3366947 RepID=UPI0037452DC0